MDLGLKDKVVLVSGGGSGIGLGIVESFAAEGAITIILGLTDTEPKRMRDELAAKGQFCDFWKLDLREEDAVKRTVQEIMVKYGHIDVVVNNAGVNDAVGLKQGPSHFVDSLHKNLVHYYTLVHYTVEHLIESRGNIINIGSKAGITGQGGTSGYAAAKGAINGLTREWALDLAEHGIRSNCIIPAECITPLYEKWLESTPDPKLTLTRINDTVPLGKRTTSVRELADAVVFVASSRSSHTTGQILHVDGGYVKLDRAYTMDTPHLKTSFED